MRRSSLQYAQRQTNLTPEITTTFKAFSTAHVIALVLILGAAIAVPGVCRLGRFRRYGNTMARALAALLAVIELLWYAYLSRHGQLEFHESLPLHMCDISIWAVIFALFTQKRLLYEWSYFFGVGGGLQALLTPELEKGFPSLLALKFFFSHGGIIVGVAFLTWVIGMRPTWRSIWRMFIAGNIYMVVVGIFNYFAGTNYGYLAHKPTSASLLDFLGPWPWYLLSLQLISILIMVVLYLPFAIRDRLRAGKAGTACPADSAADA